MKLQEPTSLQNRFNNETTMINQRKDLERRQECVRWKEVEHLCAMKEPEPVWFSCTVFPDESLSQGESDEPSSTLSITIKPGDTHTGFLGGVESMGYFGD